MERTVLYVPILPCFLVETLSEREVDEKEKRPVMLTRRFSLYDSDYVSWKEMSETLFNATMIIWEHWVPMGWTKHRRSQ